MIDTFRIGRRNCGLAWIALTLTSASAYGADDFLGYELVGQVWNVSPAQSLQYGYLNRVSGLDSASTTPGLPVSESTALFSFFNDTATQQVINNGPIRVIDRTGISVIYFNPSGGGDFASPNTLRAGSPIQTSTLRHQVVIDTSTGYFTANFEMTVTSAHVFQLNGSSYRLGKGGMVYHWTVYGKLTTLSGPPSAQIAGFASGVKVEPIEMN
jgi:hypothetical protein